MGKHRRSNKGIRGRKITSGRKRKSSRSRSKGGFEDTAKKYYCGNMMMI